MRQLDAVIAVAAPQPLVRSNAVAPYSERAPLRFFISYKRDDQYIADCLVRLLKEIDPSISCFFDQDIPEGNQWAEQINDELKNCNRLILVYTGNQKNYETCVYEVATFQALHFEGARLSETDTVTCLHDTDEIPTTFRAYQSCKIMTADSDEGQKFARRMNLQLSSPRDFYLSSPCGQFFKRLAEQYHGTIVPGGNSVLEQLIATRAEEITKAFVYSSDPMILDKVMYPRMWLELDRDTIAKIREHKLTAVPDETTIQADDNPNALNIFGLDSNKTTWGHVRSQCKKSSRTDTVGWMAEANAAMVAVVRDETVRPIELGFRSIDTRTGPDVYRCILTRRSSYRSGRQLLYLLFVRSRNRKLANDDAMASHLALLLMTTRFRFEVLKGEWSFPFERDKEQFDEQAQRFLNLIEKAEYEADEYCIMNSLANAFSESDQRTIQEMAALWEKDLKALQKVIASAENDLESRRKEMLQFIKEWLPRNGAFLEMVTASFLQRLHLDVETSARAG